MGSFAGHIIPGSFFLIIALWQLIQTFILLFKKSKYDCFDKVAFSIKSKCCKKPKPLEAIVKIVACCIGMVIEGLGFIYGFPAMYQHFTMYASFCFCGIVDLLLFYNIKLPGKLDFMFHSIAFIMEGIMFQFHLHGRELLDVVIHTLLYYSCYFTGTCIFIAAFVSISIQITLRIIICISILVQGSWFWQAGAVIYPQFNMTKWESNHGNVATIVMIFCWHIIINSILTLILYFIIKFIYRHEEVKSYKVLNNDEVDDDKEKLELINEFSI